jgi:hypothetical protein
MGYKQSKVLVEIQLGDAGDDTTSTLVFASFLAISSL